MSTAMRGFTLIELIVVIAILGILAATALPRFVNNRDDALLAATNAIAGALSSASAINFSGRTLNSSLSNTIPIAVCSDASSLLGGGMPTGYSFGNLPIPTTQDSNGTPTNCTVYGPTKSDGTPTIAIATIIGVK